MAQIDILVNDRSYRVACQDGQEERLLRIAAHLDREARALASDLGQIGEARLLLLTALTVCDELFELQGKLAEIEERAKPMDAETIGGATRVIEAAAKRIEAMSERAGAN
ncbi:MAG: cell division protein ZapA [Parvularculaceae bacterium]|nr:cell division protein ZapA [Parvularculaceae bacterium]